MALVNADSASIQTGDEASGTGNEPVAAAEPAGLPLEVDGIQGRTRVAESALEADAAWLAEVEGAVTEDGWEGMEVKPALVFEALRKFRPAIRLPGVRDGDDIDDAANRKRLVGHLSQRLQDLAAKPELRKVGGLLFKRLPLGGCDSVYRFGPVISKNILTGTSKTGLSLAMPYGPGRCPACNLSLEVGGEDSTCFHCYCSRRNQNVDTRAKVRGNLKLLRKKPGRFWQRFVDQVQGEPTMRMFSFGDAPHPDFLLQLAAAAAQCKTTRFWVPTLVGYLSTFQAALARLLQEPNVCLRHSSLVIGKHPTTVGTLPSLAGLTYSVVVRPADRDIWRSSAHLCPASNWQDGNKSASSCTEAKCDACWRREVPLVAYPLS